jgi:hypothetical protein
VGGRLWWDARRRKVGRGMYMGRRGVGGDALGQKGGGRGRGRVLDTARAGA